MSPEQAAEGAEATESAEVQRLRIQVAQLQDELASLQAWANGIVADAQRRVFWLDRIRMVLRRLGRGITR